MKIAIIGAGWVGCHLAFKLKKNHDVKLYEAEEIFSQTSLKNQNRLHRGFHYARNSATREMCNETFEVFIEQYPHLVKSVERNIYAIPRNGSKIDFNTYKKIFSEWNYEEVDVENIVGVEGCINVDEKHIDPIKSKEFFTEELKEIVEYKKIDSNNLKTLSKKYDLVINCTNNVFNEIKGEIEYELNTLFIYEKLDDPGFDALTFVDGDLFSLYPYLDNTYLLSHVKHSPDASINDEQRLERIENAIISHFPDFKKYFKFLGSNKSYKSKVVQTTDPRIPVYERTDNIINVFTGKIQGIFYIESIVREVINELNSLSAEDLKKLFMKYLDRYPTIEEEDAYLNTGRDDFESRLSTCDERKSLMSSPSMAVLISGHPRNMRFLKDFLDKKVFYGKDVDVFVFSWDQWGHWGTETDVDASTCREELENFFGNYPRIKKYKIESNLEYLNSDSIDESIKFFNFSRSEEKFIKSQLYAVNQSYKLMEEYMLETGKTYDIVLKTRFEMGIREFVLDDELANDVRDGVIFFPDANVTGHGHPHPSYCQLCDDIYNEGGRRVHIMSHSSPVCDSYAYGSVESMKTYCSVYDVYEKLAKKFEDFNIKSMEKLNTPHTRDGHRYVFELTPSNDLAAMRFYFCSYPERYLMYVLKEYMLVRSRKLVLTWEGHSK